MYQPGITRTSSWARLALLLCLLIGLLAVTGGLAAPRAHAQTTITVSPDKRSILEHFKATGEVLDGCEISQGSRLAIS